MSDRLLRDVHQAARALARTPGLTATVVLTLALGIGGTTAIFSIVYGALFRPLPYRDADRLVVIRMERTVEGTAGPVRALFPLSALPELRAGTRGLEAIAFYSTEDVQLRHGGFAHAVRSAAVSDGFFETLGGSLHAGRWPTASADDHQSVVVSERLADRLFGPTAAIGKAVTIAGQSHVVVGVADRTFQFPTRTTDVWVAATDVPCCRFAAVGRLAPEADSPRAAADVNTVVRELAAVDPRVYSGATATVSPVRAELAGDLRTPLLVLLAAVGLLLAVACANAANLLTARNLVQARERAIRVALGASRGRLAREALVEAGVLAAAAAVVGVIAAQTLVRAPGAVEPALVPTLDASSVGLDATVLGFTVVTAALTTIAIGLLPSLWSRPAAAALRSDAGSAGAHPNRRRLMDALVILQLALSVVLLVGAGLLGRSLLNLMTKDLGVRPDGVAAAAVNLAHGRRVGDTEALHLVDATLERIRALPGVQDAGAGSSLPPSATTSVVTLKRSGDTVDYQAVAVPATQGYFRALGTRLLYGRLFLESDREGQPEVMIMTVATARRFFGTEDALGQTMTLPVLRNGVVGRVEAALVGVIENVKYSGLQAAPDDAIYRPLRQQPWSTLYVVVRGDGDAATLAARLREEIAAIDPEIAISSVDTLAAILAREAAEPRFRTTVLVMLAALSMTVASLGLSGIVAHRISRRRREIGVRMALGAGAPQILSLVCRDAVRLAAGGLVAGIAAAAATTRMLAGMLHGVGPVDGLSFTAAAALLVVAAAAATWLPARKATGMNPLDALRAE